MKKERIIYIHNGRSSFVNIDIEILKSKFDVLEFHFDVQDKKKIPFIFIKQLLFLIKNFRIKRFVTQFGGFHSFLPSLFCKLFFKNHFLILSGTDCVSFPSIDYGNFNKLWLGIFTKLSIKLSTKLIPVSNELVKYKYTYQENDYPYQGYAFHIKGKTPSFEVVHYGYDSNLWKFQASKKPKTFVTIAANLSSRFGVSLKGIDLILEAARLLPDCNFYIIGGNTINSSIEIPNNVHLLGLFKHNELPEIIGEFSFYLQLSMSEGFPNALCESMLCGCIPIVSNVSSMPFIVGETGFVLKKKNATLLKEIIDLAITRTDKEELSRKARLRIQTNFTFEKRKEKLLQIISK